MKKKTTAILLTTAFVLLTSCGSSGNDTSSAGPDAGNVDTESSEDPAGSSESIGDEFLSLLDEDENSPLLDLVLASDEASFTGEGVKTAFVKDPEFGETIHDADTASMAIYNNMDKIGAGDGSVVLQYDSTRPTETGVTYYTFNQVNNYVRVYGSSLKLIVDKDGKAIGMVSAVVPNLKVPDTINTNFSAEDAEALVREEYKDEDINVISGATEEVLLPATEGTKLMYYAWVVYSMESGDTYDTAYMAHYVSKAGKYLYCLPVSEPGTLEALTGDIATFAFDGGTTGTLKTSITYSDGSTADIEVPIMYDGETGEALLADPDRQVLCADYADYTYNGTLTPVKCGEGDKLVNSQIMDYYHFLLVYDFFDDLGWTGPDGEGTPSLLLMNMVDANGKPVDNAYYQGKARGFQIFNFSDIYNYGEPINIMAHEFTHCFTGTTMTTNIYLNDTGAINEGMSDIIGNLVEILLEGYTEYSWLIGDPVEIYRSMSDPHKYKQPEFVGDRYYLPAVSEGTDNNDNGGVHVNSSLLNMISWYLDQAGMEPSDQLYFWMNVALAMTPRTDYPQMAELLPWVMENSGYSKFVPAVEDAVKKTRIGLGEDTQTAPKDCGKIRFTYDFNELNNYNVQATFSPVSSDGSDDIVTWPAADTNWVSAVLPEGEYTVSLSFTPKTSKNGENEESGSESGEEESGSESGGEEQEAVAALYTPQGWHILSQSAYDDIVKGYGSKISVSVEEGKVVLLETDSLAAAIEE